MNILYYLEPLVEQQNPYFRAGALKNTINRQARNLLKYGHEISILTSSHIYKRCIEEGVDFNGIQVFTFSLNEVLKYYSTADESATVNYFYKEEQIDIKAYSQLYKDKLRDYQPDVIASWESPCNILKESYPDALAIHMMPGFFSRVPFPELTFLDPCGFFKNSSLIKYNEKIKNYSPKEDELQLVQEVKRVYFDNHLTSLCPFSKKDLDPQGKYEKLILLPLQVSGYFAFDHHTQHKNQMDLLIHALSVIPKHIGVVVTQYVTPSTKDTPINPSTLSFIKESFPNLIYKPEFDQIDSISQYLLLSVDAVITVSSSLAFQAAFLDKPVYSIGNSHVNIVSKPFESLVKSDFKLDDTTSKVKSNRNVLAFMLTRLMPLTVPMMYNGRWFSDYLGTMLAKYKNIKGTNDKRPIELFELVDTPIVKGSMGNYISDFIKFGKPHVAIKKLAGIKSPQIAKKVEIKHKVYSDMLSDKYDAYSFDIFDTLVVRPFAKPTDLFRMLDEDVAKITNNEIMTFCECRVKAEQSLRMKLNEHNEGSGPNSTLKFEITIDEIYDEMKLIFDISDAANLHAVMELEKKTEIEMLYPRESGIELYNLALSTEKPVFITSDMYLDRETIEAILLKNNIKNYTHLYLSSEVGLRKHEGHLFDLLLTEQGFSDKPEKLFHVGDNPHGDISAAKEKGITTLRTERTLDLFYKNKPSKQLFYGNRNKASLAESIVVGMCSNKIYDDPKAPYWGDTLYHGNTRNLGYFGLGWMFFTFTKWIIEEAIKDGVTDLYFLARDGEILKLVYDEISKCYKNAPKSHYLLASRRSARVASIKNKSDLSKLAKSVFHNGSIRKFLEGKLGFNASSVDCETLESFGFGKDLLETVIKTNQQKESLFQLTMHLSNEIIANAKQEGELLSRYFADQGLTNPDKKPSVVDIGYAGTMQDAMTRLLSRDIGGYYMMTFEQAIDLKKKGQTIKGFAGDFVNKDHSNHPICKLGLAFEVVFSNTQGSFIKMRDNNGTYEPVFESTIGEEVKKRFIPEMQDGITSFAKDITERFGERLQNIFFESNSCFAVWSKTLRQPSGRDAELFEGVTFDDNFAGVQMRYMVPPRAMVKNKERALRLTVWRQGTETFFRIPYVSDLINSKIKSKKNSNPVKELGIKDKASEIVPHINDTENKPIKVKLIGVFLRKIMGKNNKKVKKFESDPETFFFDSKNKWVVRVGKLCYPQTSLS